MVEKTDTSVSPLPASSALPGLRILGGATASVAGAERAEKVLTREALELVVALVRAFRPRRDELLARRRDVQAKLDGGQTLDFSSETASLRASDFKGPSIPKDLTDRRVEITGPVERKMIINALSSGADVFMADFEDSNAPTWSNLIEGQVNLMDAVRRTIEFTDPTTHKHYALGGPDTKIATLIVRPRGLHLPERHIEVDGVAAPGFLVDFGLYFFHNARALLDRGSGPYFYLPKLESHLEARLWNDVFAMAEEKLGLPKACVRATVLIETLPAAFQMDEILYELRERSAGLNCGRWDYIFSFIKKQRADAKAILPDRSQVTMEQPCMRAYTQLLVKTCHRRGVHAMGGMAAQIPIKNDPAANDAALAKVRADKLREVKDGHDGTWVAHPGLVAIAREVFDANMRPAGAPNQLGILRDDVNVTASDLLRIPTGTRTEEGLRHNIRVGVQYLEAWLRGSGCVPLYNLMEDAATAEISRAQVWQWIHHKATLEDGRLVTVELFRRLLDEEMKALLATLGSARFESGRFTAAIEIFDRLSTASSFEDFLTLPAYDVLTA